jgi:hypothetical protein
MKPKITDKNKEKLMASIVREMNLPRLTESVRIGLYLEPLPLDIDRAERNTVVNIDRFLY